MSYKFLFPSTAYQEYTVAICWTPTRTTSWSENYRQEQIVIKGTTTHDIVVPWESSSPYLPCSYPKGRNGTLDNGSISNGWISVYLISPITNASADPVPCSFMVYVAGTESLKFSTVRVYLGISGLPQPSEPQGNFGAISEYSPSRVLPEDNVQSIRDLLKIHRSIGDLSFNTVTLTTATLPFELRNLLNKYLYMRGSVSVRFMANATSTKTLAISPNATDNRFRAFSEILRIQDQGWDDVVVPYSVNTGYSFTNFAYNANGSIASFRVDVIGTGSAEAGLAFCDDLSLSQVIYSPMVTYP